MSCAKQKSKRVYYDDHKENNSYRTMSIKDSRCEYGYIFYDNMSEDGTLEETVKFDDLKGLEPIGAFSGHQAKIKVGAGKTKIIVLKRNGPKA